MCDGIQLTLSGADLLILLHALLEVRAIPPTTRVASVANNGARLKELDELLWTRLVELRRSCPGPETELTVGVRLTREDCRLLCDAVENAVLALGSEYTTRMGSTVREAQITLERLRTGLVGR